MKAVRVSGTEHYADEAPELLKRYESRVLGGVVDVVVGAELARQRDLVLPAGDRDGLEVELRRELDAEMSEPAEAQHRNGFARPLGHII
jgi:hypothetical protein